MYAQAKGRRIVSFGPYLLSLVIVQDEIDDVLV